MLLAPVIGFDTSGYRLGYGGGFFDRTLAALTGPRTVIGIGFDCAEIPSIGPHSLDIPMDRIVTESGFRRRPVAGRTRIARLRAGSSAQRLYGLPDRGGDRWLSEGAARSPTCADLAVTRAFD